YPVLYFIHDGAGNHQDNRVKSFSLLRNAMTASRLTQAIVVEIDIDILGSDVDYLQQLVTYVDANYRTKESRDNRVIMANGKASINTLGFANNTDLFSDCFIFNAQLSETASN